jgi:LysM repeat protein
MREKLSSMLAKIRRGRGMIAFCLVLALCALTVFLVKPSSGLIAQPLPVSAHSSSSRYFAPERLDSYSGNDFNLFPDLISLLDLLEQSLASASSKGPTIQDYTRFVNHEFVTFQYYTIQSRDNYWMVAKRNGYTIDTIVGCNPQLEKVVCFQGQKVLLPSKGGSLHCVQPDETVEKIALLFAVDPENIYQANRISRKWGVIPGMWLFIPGAKPRHLSENMHKEYLKRSLFRSPLTGRYTSFVGMRIHPTLGFSKYHNGVDIACHQGTWVGASAGGTVEYAGWGGAIGNYIKVDHHNGYETMYGHLSKIYVHEGQKIKGGQLIARSGSTGRSTGPHLHFTIWENHVVKNPMDFLW